MTYNIVGRMTPFLPAQVYGTILGFVQLAFFTSVVIYYNAELAGLDNNARHDIECEEGNTPVRNKIKNDCISWYRSSNLLLNSYFKFFVYILPCIFWVISEFIDAVLVRWLQGKSFKHDNISACWCHIDTFYYFQLGVRILFVTSVLISICILHTHISIQPSFTCPISSNYTITCNDSRHEERNTLNLLSLISFAILCFLGIAELCWLLCRKSTIASSAEDVCQRCKFFAQTFLVTAFESQKGL